MGEKLTTIKQAGHVKHTTCACGPNDYCSACEKTKYERKEQKNKTELSKEEKEKRMPLKTYELVGALHERIHKEARGGPKRVKAVRYVKK